MTEAMPMVSIEVPEPVYRRLQHIAEMTHRSVEDVLVSTVNVTLPATPDLPDEVSNELAAMSMFSDDALWAAAEPSLSAAEQTRLSQLNQIVDARPLTAAESQELGDLLAGYDYTVLRRARALALLTHRGYDVALFQESFQPSP